MGLGCFRGDLSSSESTLNRSCALKRLKLLLNRRTKPGAGFYSPTLYFFFSGQNSVIFKMAPSKIRVDGRVLKTNNARLKKKPGRKWT